MSEDGKDKKEERQFKVIDKRKTAENESDAEAAAGGSAEPEKAGEPEHNHSHEQHGLHEIHAGETGGENEQAGFMVDFATFIYSLNTQALLFLGKIPNPISKKYEKDIDTAKYLIDTIDMLSKKTKGNLDENESKLIENILYDLRMAYISEKK